MGHREGIREFLKDVDLSGKIVHDWGCGTKPIIRYLPHNGTMYFGVDSAIENSVIDTGTEQEHYFKHDMTRFLYLNYDADIAFCLEALEHVTYPDRVLETIWSNLKPGGILYLSVPFMYPVHSDHDLWRFTDIGIRVLLERNGFVVEEVADTGNALQIQNRPDLNRKEAFGWVVKARRNQYEVLAS